MARFFEVLASLFFIIIYVAAGGASISIPSNPVNAPPLEPLVEGLVDVVRSSRQHLSTELLSQRSIMARLQDLAELSRQVENALSELPSKPEKEESLPTLYQISKDLGKAIVEKVGMLNEDLVKFEKESISTVQSFGAVLSKLVETLQSLHAPKEDLPSVMGQQFFVQKMTESDRFLLANTNKSSRFYFDEAYRLFKLEMHHDSHRVFMASWAAHNATLARNQAIDLDEMYILDYVQYSAFKAGNLPLAIWVCKYLLEDPKFIISAEQVLKFKTSKDFYEAELTSSHMKELLANADNEPVEKQIETATLLANTKQYEACADQFAGLTLASRPYAICRYDDRNRHPILLLAPVKEEIYSLDPLVMFFHDVLLDHHIESLKKESQDKFANAGVVSPTTQQSEIQVYTRKGKVAWLETASFPTITRRLEVITGLNPYEDGSEMYQVCHYNIGGHYIPHYDILFDAIANDTRLGDRIATMLIYLANVEKGGSTVFPNLRLKVDPVKGGAVFWFNFHKNETNDLRSLHAACPVLQGEKWVTNKWFRFRGQILHKPCAKDQLEPFTVNDLNLPKETWQLLSSTTRSDKSSAIGQVAY